MRLLAEALDDFVAEDQKVLRAGLATARGHGEWHSSAPRPKVRVPNARRKRLLYRVPDRRGEIAQSVPIRAAGRRHLRRGDYCSVGLHPQV